MIPLIEKIKNLDIIPKENLFYIGSEANGFNNFLDLLNNSNEKLNLNINLLKIIFESGNWIFPKMA